MARNHQNRREKIAQLKSKNIALAQGISLRMRTKYNIADAIIPGINRKRNHRIK